jgi:hypothetical protein
MKFLGISVNSDTVDQYWSDLLHLAGIKKGSAREVLYKILI